SIGEYVAACIAGVLSLTDAVKLVGTRARLIAALPENASGMATVFADGKTVAALLAREPMVSIAALNAPTNTVISGELRALDRALGYCTAKGIKSQKLAVSHAFHSPFLESILDEFRTEAAKVAHQRPRIPFAANVTGGLHSDNQPPDSDYWTLHL